MSSVMEVDSETLKPPQILQPAFTLSPLLPLVAQSPLVHLPKDEFVAFNKAMNKWSSHRFLAMRIEMDDPEIQEAVLVDILLAVAEELNSKANFIEPLPLRDARKLIKDLNDDELKELREGVKAAIDKHNWAGLTSHSIFKKPVELSSQGFMRSEMKDLEQLLATFYNTPFLGDTAKDLVDYLEILESEIVTYHKVPYAKAFSVVQSSGTGKSRMLTEAGKSVFTLPICLRKDGDPGYPPPDLEVVNYFNSLTKENDLSYTAHTAVACFIAAAHMKMHEWLKKAQEQNVEDLHSYWHDHMEPSGDRHYRNQFFSAVVAQASSLKSKHQSLRESPKRTQNIDGEQESKTINQLAQTAYEAIIQNATKDLMTFLSSIKPRSFCVTYFDEAHGMDGILWVILRLLQYQNYNTPLRMWCIFMGTKSSISYYAPGSHDMVSLRGIQEMARLLPPYVALGFDHHAIANAQDSRTVTMGELQSIKHLAQYGRPLWKAQLSQSGDSGLIKLAGMKLTNGQPFSAKDEQHVFSVLSQRLCLDPVLSGTEAVKLADRSVAHHMRLLIGRSDDGATFYTHSPSEPMLALGSAHLLYDTTNHRLPGTLETFCLDLCGAGLVEKGTMDELAARTLLLVARDFTAPIQDYYRDLLKPVRLLDFLDTLLGKEWAGAERSEFDTAFRNAYVNFTHWIVTKDAMPLEPDSKLLANLWARSAALQCCFRQNAIDFTIPVYIGSIDAGAVFDPSRLSGIPGQVKFKVSGGPQAESRIQPFGIPRNPYHPLPYLALLMELGTESIYEGCGKIKSTASGPTTEGGFSKLTTALATAVGKHELRLQQVGKNKKDPKLIELKEMVSNAQQAADSFNRYAISVRGASPEVYQVLKRAGIAKEFAALLNITTQLPGNEMPTIQHMRPLERLEDGSNHTAWMSEYFAHEGV